MRAITMGQKPVRVRAAAAPVETDIEALLVWTYQRQRAHALDGGGVGLHEAERLAQGIEWAGSSCDGVAAIARIGELGCRVDGGGYSHGEIDPDATTIHEAVTALARVDAEAAGFAVMFAASAREPDWCKGVEARLDIERDAKGRAIPLRDRSGHVVPGQYRQRWNVRPEVIENARAIYVRWWDALDVLAKGLRGSLKTHEATGPARARKPWLG